MLVQAGRVALAHFRDVAVRRKADGSTLTDADLAAERVLVAALRDAFPGDGIVSEEGAAVTAESGHGTWYVDPIDGTSVFTEGLAHWGPTVARLHGGRWDLGGFYQPRLDEFWFASREHGADRDGHPLTPISTAPPKHRTMMLPSRSHLAGPMPWRGKSRALGSTAAHLAMVAGGGASAVVVPSWSPWDVGCGLLLLELTEHAVVDLSGAPMDPMLHERAPFIAGHPALLDDLAAAVRLAIPAAHAPFDRT